MRKGSVLVQRAALFAAVVVLIAVAAGLSAFGLVNWWQTDAAVREQLMPQARVLAEMAADSAAEGAARNKGEVRMFALSGGTVWYADEGRRVVNLTDDTAYPESLSKAADAAFEGAEKQGSVRVDGKRVLYAMVPIYKSGRVVGLVTATAAARGAGRKWLWAALSALFGAAAAAIIGRKFVKPIMAPAMKPVQELRDVAVAMSEGNLEARADEKAGGEAGELGKAINSLSYQLSRNMYTLIVERNRLRNMINGLSEGIVAIDAKGEITHTNQALDKFFTKQKLALHLPDHRMKLIPDKSIWEDFDRVIETGEPVTRTMESRDMVLRITITPIVDEINAIAGAVGLFSDITQMERLERTRRDYVSNVSHELRTPLTAMRALVEPLKDGMVTKEEDRQRYYDIILREILRLSRLINDQLELSRLQSGTLSIQKSRMRLEELVLDVCDRYGTIAAEHGLELRVDTDFSQCPPVYANADRVEQMLIILLDNAIKYTEKGSVAVSADWDDEKVTLHIADTGIGIEEQDLPYVFDRFYKVDKAHSGKGSGLGLSIARELLKRMDEDIWVESEKGVGTTFSFTLHCKDEEREPAAE